VPAGLGEPVFDKLQADIAKAMFSIPAIKGLEFGEGFAVATMPASQHNDPFVRNPDGSIGTASNHHGAISAISTGQEIVLRIVAKPLALIARPQQTVDRDGNPTQIEIHGRHDPTVLPRLVPIAEAMLALVPGRSFASSTLGSRVIGGAGGV
jgi:chorismate synthase